MKISKKKKEILSVQQHEEDKQIYISTVITYVGAGRSR